MWFLPGRDVTIQLVELERASVHTTPLTLAALDDKQREP